MRDLIERLEAATAIDQRDALISAYNAIYGVHPEFDSSTRALRFMRMLNAEAYESAALTLVPEGIRGVHIWETAYGFQCTLLDHDRAVAGARAAESRALAIVIAALRVKGDA